MKRKIKKFLIFILRPGVVVLLGLPLAVLLAYHLAFWGRVLPKVYLCQEEVAGLTKSELGEKTDELSSFQKTFLKTLNFTYQNENWEINLDDIQFNFDQPQTIKKVYQVGRDGQFFQNLISRVILWGKAEIIPLQYSVNERLMEEKIASLSAKINIPQVEPQIIVSQDSSGDKKVSLEPGKDGLEVDQKKLLSEIEKRLSCFNPDFINIPVRDISSAISTAERKEIIKKSEKFLNKTLKITYKDQSWLLSDQNLVNFLSVQSDVNEQKVNQYLEDLKKLIETNPENATLQIENGKAVVFKPSKNGVLLDRKQTKERFFSAISELEKTQEAKQKEIEIAITIIPPKITTEEVNNLGIKEIIGSGNSKFAGSIEERIYNIALATSKLNGLVIAPEEVFSFNQAVGDISEATGYKKAYIIKQGRTVLGDGGGVCQVSTTLFRAILNAGLTIEERHAHAYRVSYYEQGSSPGLDATVFSPTADLKFKNDTDNHILIQGEINKKARTLSFKLYGTSDGRMAEIGKASIKDITPPPPDLYQDDPTLPLGQIKQIDWKAWGAKVNFRWKVTRGEEILQNKIFYSNYQPWQAIFLRGTKSQ